MSVVGSEKHLKLAQEAAEKSLVMLKNDGILPLRNVKKVALIGPNADNFTILIGNYNGEPVRPVTPLKALREKLGDRNVLYTTGCPIVPGVFTNHQIIGVEYLFHSENGKLKSGLKAEYFDEPQFKGEPKLVKVDNNIDFYWQNSPLNGQIEDQFSIRWSGILIPKKSGTYMFGGNVNVKINDKTADSKGEILEKGKQYAIQAEINVKSSPWKNSIEPSAMLAWVEASRDFRKEALDAASKADVVIFCGGISAEFEGEEMPLEIDGFSHGDRTHINLPSIQEDLLKELQATGKPIVYVNFSGSSMALNWESENVSAIIQGFYPGENTGTALTRLLFGEVNPSGRLPVTFYKSVTDLPDFDDYSMDNRTYRYFKGEPLYPFGFGLSYTTFEYSNLKVSGLNQTTKNLTVNVTVKNSGNYDGDEVVQVYLNHENSKYLTPIRALKGFTRVHLKAGESTQLSFEILEKDLIEIDQEGNSVPIEKGILISVGGSQPSAQSIKQQGCVESYYN